MADDETYGWAATIERRGANGVEEIEIHRIGRRRVVERAARLTRGYIRTVSCEPLSRDAYERVYGVPRRT